MRDDSLVFNLIDKAKKGDELAFETLLNQFYPLIKGRATRFYLMGFDEEDFAQEASIAFFKAVKTYDGKSRFESYAKACVDNRFSDIFRREKNNKNKVLSEYVTLEDSFRESIDFTDLILDKLTFKQTASDFFALLSPREAKVFLHLISGRNYIEIALLLGKSPKSIDNAIQRIKQKLGSFLQEN